MNRSDMVDNSEQTTKLLLAIEQGDENAAASLLPLVYDELRSCAGKLIGKERRDHTLQRTALVHEAYLKLVKGQVSFKSRAHFFNAAALAMRRILVDHAAERNALKRGGGRDQVSLDDVEPAAVNGEIVDWIDLDEAMKKLAAVSPRQHQVVMLRFFSGLSESEVAELLELGHATVERDWAMARAWLYRAMQEEQ